MPKLVVNQKSFENASKYNFYYTLWSDTIQISFISGLLDWFLLLTFIFQQNLIEISFSNFQINELSYE